MITGLGKKEETFGNIKQWADSKIYDLEISFTWGNLPVGLSLGDVLSGMPETGMRDDVQNTLILVLNVIPRIISKTKHFLRKSFN
jgi:hypothetical protein